MLRQKVSMKWMEGMPQGRPKAKALGYQPHVWRFPEGTKAEALVYLEARAHTCLEATADANVMVAGVLDSTHPFFSGEEP
jgi:hypothetical protein